MSHLKQLLLLLVLLPFLPEVNAQDEPTDARTIIDTVERLYRGNSSRADLTMEIRTPQYERTMKMSAESMGRELSFFRILSPKKDRGIATLKREQEMWNFFPKINKVIKVPPSMMMGSWMGSDFTNDDLVKETELIDAYDLSLQETETEYHIKLTPREDTVTVWARIDYIVDRQRMIPVAQIFYDDNDEPIRRMEFREPKQFEGKLLPSVMEMIPLNKSGHSTLVRYETLTFDPADIDERLFSLRNLKRRF